MLPRVMARVFFSTSKKIGMYPSHSIKNGGLQETSPAGVRFESHPPHLRMNSLGFLPKEHEALRGRADILETSFHKDLCIFIV